VVIHTPRHARSFAELTGEEVALVAKAWIARAANAGSSYVHPLINEGRAAGASLAHTHSQLVWLPETPPTVQAEQPEGLAKLLDPSLVIAEAKGVVALCHPVGLLPYETLIGPTSPGDPWPEQDALATALGLLRDVVAKLREVEGPVPWNAWLHHGATWHIELLPRLSVLAGLELGAGIYVNSLPPEQAAANLRS
jgi:UDPglucose--hexose-1-phosphate uridylyltransferase